MSVVVGELARPGALLAIDAVATAGSKPPAGKVDRTVVPGFEGGAGDHRGDGQQDGEGVRPGLIGGQGGLRREPRL